MRERPRRRIRKRKRISLGDGGSGDIGDKAGRKRFVHRYGVHLGDVYYRINLVTGQVSPEHRPGGSASPVVDILQYTEKRPPTRRIRVGGGTLVVRPRRDGVTFTRERGTAIGQPPRSSNTSIVRK